MDHVGIGSDFDGMFGAHPRGMEGVDSYPALFRELARRGWSDADLAGLAGADMLGGHTIGDIVDAQAHALPEALARAGRPVRTIDIAKLDEKTLGALLMHFMIETILAGRLLGLDPFDQPAVELAKVLTKERLAKGA
jgi:glucose-6-phosphate isomerase